MPDPGARATTPAEPVPLAVLDAISTAGGEANDDLFGCDAGGAWIADGATGIQEVRLLPGSSDAGWLVSRIDDFVRSGRLAPPIPAALAELEAFVFREFALARNDSGPSGDLEGPSASLATVTIDDGRLFLSSIGDCVVLSQAPTGEITRFGSSRVTELDARVVAALTRRRAERPELSYDALWQELVPLIRRNRRLKNTADGYWVVSTDSRWSDAVQFGSVPIEGPTRLLLLTDGFYRLVDTYHVHDDRSLFSRAAEGGLARLERDLRAIESEDPDCERFPRLKRADDATAVLLETRGRS